MTAQTFGIILLAIALLLGIVLQIMPDHIENRARRYVRPKQRKGRFERW